MKLPESLPPLAAPSFVLANPVAVQVGVLALIFAAAVAACAWVFVTWQAGQAGAWHAAVLLMALAGFSGVFYPRNWRRWVVFAADPKGVYLGNFHGQYLFVPWADVGPSEIGVAGRGSNRQRTVILPLRLDDAQIERVLGRYQPKAIRLADAKGFIPYGIGNALQNVEHTQRQIEAIRAHASL